MITGYWTDYALENVLIIQNPIRNRLRTRSHRSYREICHSYVQSSRFLSVPTSSHIQIRQTDHPLEDQADAHSWSLPLGNPNLLVVCLQLPPISYRLSSKTSIILHTWRRNYFRSSLGGLVGNYQEGAWFSREIV